MPRHIPVYSPTRERKIKSLPKKSKGKRTWVFWWMGFFALVGLFLVGIQNAYPDLTSSKIFQLEQISVNGNRLMSAQEVVALSGLELGCNLFKADLLAATDRIRSKQIIHKIVLLREPPEGLIISIEERKPVALVCTSVGLQGLDREGMIFQLPKVPLDLPLVTGLKGILGSKWKKSNKILFRIANFVESLRICNPAFWDDISEIYVQSPKMARVFLVGDGLELRMNFEDTESQIQRFEAYLVAGPNLGAQPSYVDLRFRNQVIIGKS